MTTNNQIKKKFIGDKQVGAGQILIEKSSALMGVDDSDAEIELLKINAEGKILLAGSEAVVLDEGGKVPSAQLPSYVDDVLEFDNLAALPAEGESGKIYVTLDSNQTYRWSGSAYIEISASPGSTDAVTEGSTNLYFTAARAKWATVTDSITDGVTDVAPSQNAVHDALALKQESLGTGTENQFLRGDLTWVSVPAPFVPKRAMFTLNSTDISNQYLDLADLAAVIA